MYGFRETKRTVPIVSVPIVSKRTVPIVSWNFTKFFSSGIMGTKRQERKGFNMKRIFAVMLVWMIALGTTLALAETEISVTGTGEVRISADTAVISLGVSARDRDVLKAQQKVNETIAAIRKALLGEAVKEEDITTDFMNIYASYDYRDEEEQLAAYNANTTLAIRVTDMETVGKLIDVAFAAGANTLNGISFSASDTEEAKTEAMKKAVADAKKKAEILAEASGLKITKIESISEGGVYSYENTVGNAMAKGIVEMAEAAADAGTVVNAARLIVSASVIITYEAEVSN